MVSQQGWQQRHDDGLAEDARRGDPQCAAGTARTGFQRGPRSFVGLKHGLCVRQVHFAFRRECDGACGAVYQAHTQLFSRAARRRETVIADSPSRRAASDKLLLTATLANTSISGICMVITVCVKAPYCKRALLMGDRHAYRRGWRIIEGKS